jgi:hypothetical protein
MLMFETLLSGSVEPLIDGGFGGQDGTFPPSRLI